MRNSVLTRSLLLFLAFAIPSLTHAQNEGQFQTPTNEELKMTADPKAPGAAAVYLNFEEVTNDPLHYQSVYARIKVLQEKGKELATIDVPYLRGSWKVSDIKARTIHADGTIIPLEGKPEDLLIAKKGEMQAGRMVFTLPSVEVGSILEYRYQIRYDENTFSSPQWEIQKDYFVHNAHYGFTPFQAFTPVRGNMPSGGYLEDAKEHVLSHLLWQSILPSGVTIKPNAVGVYSLNLTDIPAAPQEEWMPPIRSFRWHLNFYYTYADKPAEYWVTEAKDWSKEVDHFAEQSSTLKQAVASLIAPTDSELDKAKKLYKAVQALDNTDFSRQKSKSELKQLDLKAAKHAADIWTQKSGSKEEIAQLYLAMLRSAGLSAHAVKVTNRDLAIFNPNDLEANQLDDTIIVLSTGGKDVYLDPGEKMCPFQMVHWKHSGASGIRQSGGATPTVASPLLTYADNTLLRVGEVTLDEHGGATGTIRFGMTGQRALDLRQKALRNDLDEVKKNFDHDLESEVPEGIEAHIDHFAGLDNPDAQLVAVIKVQGTLGAATSKRLMLPGFFFESRGSHPFVNQEKREQIVDMHYAEKVTDQMVYHLPAGLTVEGAPQDGQIPWPEHAMLVTKTVSAPAQVMIVRTFARAFTFGLPTEYQSLRDFYQKVAAADQQQLVLTTAPAAKGN